MKLISHLLFAALLNLTWVSAKPEKPNVIIIMADDLGWADVGIQNEAASADIPTPHIDALFRSGLRFTNGYVANATCGPSRASMMTGRSSSRFGLESNLETGVPTSETVIPELIKPLGYTNGIIGKWHLGHEAGQLPLERGFDEFYGFLGGNHHFYTNPVWDGNEEIEFDGYLTDVLADQAVDFIERQKDGPFFLYAAFNAPHSPMMATQKYLEQVVKHQPRFAPVYEKIKKVEGRNALPNYSMANFRSPDADPEIMRLTYCAMVAGLDDGVGKIINKVEQLGIRENTLIVFLSDNGAALARPTDFGGVNLPLRSGKGTVWDGGVRVVFGASWPGTIPAGENYDGIVNATDLFTTTVELAGGRVPEDRKIDGVNLIPYLTGKTQGQPHEHFFFRRKTQSSWSLRSGDFKWVQDRKARMSSEGELYHLSSNPGESVDVSEQYPEKKLEMIKLYKSLTRDLPEPGEEKGAKERPKEEITEKAIPNFDDFSKTKHPTRSPRRGDWKVVNNTLTCSFDEELYKKHNNHGPIIIYNHPHQDAQISFSFKTDQSESITFTTEGTKGHVFRFTLNTEGYGARAFPPEGEKKSLSAARGKEPRLKAGEWMDASFHYQGENVVVRVGDDFQTTISHPSYAREKRGFTIAFNQGEFAIRDLKLGQDK